MKRSLWGGYAGNGEEGWFPIPDPSNPMGTTDGDKVFLVLINVETKLSSSSSPCLLLVSHPGLRLDGHPMN